MRLSFVNERHDDLVIASGYVNLGSADGNDIVLDGKDVSPWHARVLVDARGIVLQVLDPSAHTHVNARPIREKALLRAGDVLHLGHVAVAVKADSDAIDGAIPAARDNAAATLCARVVLRGMSGAHSGRAIAVDGRVVVGSGGDADVVVDDARIASRHSAIETTGSAIVLRSLGAAQGAMVNGVGVVDARLQPGDQIAFAQHRFIVEAPGLCAPPVELPADDAVDTHHEETPAPEGSGAALWWLLGAAALIALALYLIIHRGI